VNFTEVIAFWFDDTDPAQRFRKDPEFDRLISARFSELHRLARAGELSGWRAEPLGTLAEIIILDQFSRHLFRNTPQAFAQDSLALTLAREMVRRGQDRELAPEHRAFAYMPYMHSESRAIHRQAIALFDQPGLEESLRHEKRHKEIIDRFGRFPHRNDILGRESTQEELAFLKQPGSRF